MGIPKDIAADAQDHWAMTLDQNGESVRLALLDEALQKLTVRDLLALKRDPFVYLRKQPAYLLTSHDPDPCQGRGAFSISGDGPRPWRHGFFTVTELRKACRELA